VVEMAERQKNRPRQSRRAGEMVAANQKMVGAEKPRGGESRQARSLLAEIGLGEVVEVRSGVRLGGEGGQVS
jgi:hypothetical protein